MVHEIKRYNFNREFISQGLLTVLSEGQVTKLTYTDPLINEFSNGLNHPLLIFESLRLILESKHQSILGCNGCRIDTDYRAKDGYGTYIIHYGKPASEIINLFESTDGITKLCTVAEHKIAYKKWLDSFK
jgi:hypothetical protein